MYDYTYKLFFNDHDRPFFLKKKLKSNWEVRAKGQRSSYHFSLLLFSDPDNIKQDAELNISRLFHIILIAVSIKYRNLLFLYTLWFTHDTQSKKGSPLEIVKVNLFSCNVIGRMNK